MPVGTEIVIANRHVLDLVRRDFSRLTDNMFSRGGLRRLLEEIRDEVAIPSIDKNFEVGGRPRWEPLSPITLGFGAGLRGGAEYIASAATGTIGGRKPLTRSGQMRRAATAKARFHIARNEMTYGDWPERRWFGPVHNVEELAERAKIPHRPFTDMQPEDMVAMEEITFNYVFDNIDKYIRRRYV
jgi:phage gpG-like protein